MKANLVDYLQNMSPNACMDRGSRLNKTADAMTGLIRSFMGGKSMAQRILPPIPQGAKTLSGHPAKQVRRSRIRGEKIDMVVIDEVTKLSNKTLAAAFGFDLDKESEELAKEEGR